MKFPSTPIIESLLRYNEWLGIRMDFIQYFQKDFKIMA